MQQPLQITFRHMASSEAVDEAIREQVKKLEHFYSRIIGCHVIIELPHHHQHQGKIYEVKVILTVPGKELAVTREHLSSHTHEDVYVAIQDAFDALKKQLETYVSCHLSMSKCAS
jgi:ribosomal subunit interface protein